MQNQEFNFKCTKCGHSNCEIKPVRMAGGFLSKMFDIQNRKFTSVICSQCKYTEFYNVKSSALGSVADFFIGT